MLKIHKIQARDLPDLWFQAVYDILENGRKVTIDRGSYAGSTRFEYDYFMGHIIHPGTQPLLPDIPPSIGIPNPVEHDYIYGGENYERSYLEYLMTPIKLPGESYTYGERLTSAKVDKIENHLCNETIITEDDFWKNKKIIFLKENELHINQIELVIATYKKFGHRNNQMCMQVAQPSDMLLKDPPCLRTIDTRIQDNKLHFVVYFRSWDLWGGLPANLAGIELLKQSMATEIGVENGEMIVESKGLHVYGYAEELVKLRCYKQRKQYESRWI